ncbi:hypothetical protein BB560_002114 [Smittium megazygosporum]|uniref:MTHFR SAM-binding regulatory domain-containing protein n=1 Tax=Smittium megazygosporum TaxID=133381 RepID=A0A2T9ZFP9_9FUNG|nr:hypothetical protein BB560_004150 [Smittium megazygosporum]PVV03401.1 hypothetical protein BB560_002114 [Smittium megazygosporum]
MKIIDKIKSAQQDDRPYWSFEYFPPKTPQGVINLYERVERMTKLNPLFIDVTWRWGGKSKDLTQDICINSQTIYGIEANMHLTCTGTDVEGIRHVLENAKRNNVQNILALRGDLPGFTKEDSAHINDGSCTPMPEYNYDADINAMNQFFSAEQLIKFMRQEFGSYFCISVAGYPEGCNDISETEKDIHVLKKKVDAGADLVLSQLFYDVNIFMEWYNKCVKTGISVPIVPGIMPIQSYTGFKKMVELCNVTVPDEVWSGLSSCKEDDLAIKDFGIKYAITMIKKLFSFGIKGFHLYTLNLERSSRLILEGLQFVPIISQPSAPQLNPNTFQDVSIQKPLPWPSCVQTKRISENVRPIFWHNNVDSYILRTDSWDEFPNGRWGDSRSPAFGELDFNKFWIYPNKKVYSLWGIPKTELDIHDVFIKYCKGELESLPWSSTPIQAESSEITQNLIKLNQYGYLTINSQPSCNGAKSSDTLHGWGPKNGFVYKKAYIEFFVHPARFIKLVKLIDEYNMSNGGGNETSNIITYLATSKNTEKLYSNFNTNQPNAVTWGVFPGCEIIQPTIVEASSFLAWKDEAFDYWKMWSNAYKDKYKETHALLSGIMDTYFLMNLVDNDYTRSSDAQKNEGPQKSYFYNSSIDQAVSGFVAALASTAVLHPLDLIKIRLQVKDKEAGSIVGRSVRAFKDITGASSAEIPATASKFQKSIFNLKRFYVGLSPNIAGNCVSWGLYFGWYNWIKQEISIRQGTASGKKYGQNKQGASFLSAKQHLFASSMAGVLTQLVANPFWVIKVRMCQPRELKGSIEYKGVIDGLFKLWKAEGLKGYYKGLVPGIIGVSHGALQFMAYEEMKKYLVVKKYNSLQDSSFSYLEYLSMSTTSKLFAAAVTYPYQVVRTRMQSTESIKYKSVLSTIMIIYRGEGIQGFYKGLGPNIIRVLPGTMITFLVYEKFSAFFRTHAK